MNIDLSKLQLRDGDILIVKIKGSLYRSSELLESLNNAWFEIPEEIRPKKGNPIIFLRDNETIETMDPKQLECHGWVRKEKV